VVLIFGVVAHAVPEAIKKKLEPMWTVGLTYNSK